MSTPDPGAPGDPRLRFRVWVNGAMTEETWADLSSPDSEALIDGIQARHLALADAANDAGQRWLIEVYDPELPFDRAHWRFGTDPAAMVFPVPVVPPGGWPAS